MFARQVLASSFLLQAREGAPVFWSKPTERRQYLRDYEMMFILNPMLDEETTKAAMDRVSTLVTSNGGEVSKMDPWGKRRLAYPIKHFRDGQYVLMQFKMDPAAVVQFERSLQITDDVLRDLIVRLDEK